MVSLRGVWAGSAGLVVEEARSVSDRWSFGVGRAPDDSRAVGRLGARSEDDRLAFAADRLAVAVVELDRCAVGPVFVVGFAADLVARFGTAGVDGVVSSRLDRDPFEAAAFGALDDPADPEEREPVDADPDERPPLAGAFLAEAFLAVLIVTPLRGLRCRPASPGSSDPWRVGAIRSIFNDETVFRHRFPESWSGRFERRSAGFTRRQRDGCGHD
jgi:hypothetical protein